MWRKSPWVRIPDSPPPGEVPERFNGAVSKTVELFELPGFESLPLRLTMCKQQELGARSHAIRIFQPRQDRKIATVRKPPGCAVEQPGPILWPLALSGFAFISWKRHPWQMVYYGLTAFIIGCIIILTQSRGALLAIGVIFVGLICLRWRHGWLSLLVIAVGGAFVIELWGINAILDFLSAGISLAGSEGRMDVWTRGFYMVSDFPFTGIGMGTFENVAGALYPSMITSEVIPHTHNLFLQIAVDLGVPGLIAWLGILLSGFIAAGRVYAVGLSPGRTQIIAMGAGLLLSQLALITHGLLDAVTWGMVRPAPFVWIVWGMAMAAVGVYNTEQPHRN